jgi:hypothetical protein
MQAFYSTKRIQIYKIQQQTEIPAKLVRLIKEGRNDLEYNLSEKFSVFQGVRQSDALSTVLFNVT